jgi:hypothetical protein
MSDPQDPTPALDSCGCCEVEPPETPISNPPGQPALAYRIDTQPTFLQRMLNALPRETVPPDSPASDAAHPLAALTARAADDPTIALLDTWATAADVLTFYQERIANEGFLRTATERQSVLELARQIGYELAPGVAASAELAFTVEDAVGAPAQATVPVATKVMSVPGPGEKPQTFETIEAIVARPEWNAFPPRRDDPEQILPGMTDLFLAGVANQLQVGDALLFVGGDRVGAPSSPNWDLRTLTTVEVDTPNRRTRVAWADGLNTSPSISIGAAGSIGGAGDTGPTTTRVFAMRKRAQLFGHNAPLFKILPSETRKAFLPTNSQSANPNDWDDSPLDVGFDLDGGSTLDFDITDPKLIPGSWIALATTQPTASTHLSAPEGTRPAFPPAKLVPAPFPLTLGEEVPEDPPDVAGRTGIEAAVFQVTAGPLITSRADFAITSTVTRVTVDDASVLAGLSRRELQFFVESEELALATRPVIVAVDGKEEIPEIPDSTKTEFPGSTGNLIAVGLSVQGLRVGQKLALVGKRPNVRVVDPDTMATRAKEFLDGIGADTTNIVPIVAALDGLLQPPPDPASDEPGGLRLDDPPGVREPLAGHTFELLDQLEDAGNVEGVGKYGDGILIPLKRWTLRSRTGATGTADLPFFAVDVIPAAPKGETISEIRVIQAVFQGASRMLLELDAPLQFIYDRGSLVLSANVASATHGETVASEALGNGDPASANQVFRLQKPPLTYVSSPTDPSGGKSTLQVRVNDIAWREVPRLFGAGPDDQVYVLRRTDDGQTDVIFGDGTRGARLPTGTANIVATYRTGIGLDGQVEAGSLTLLATRPLGVRAVNNPLAATGAAPPALIEDARRNAPLTVRTIDRVVSVADVEDFARSFAGIGKAQARLLWSGTTQLVHLTVGGADGQKIPPESPVLINLAKSLLANGDPSLLLKTPIDSFVQHLFQLTLKLDIDPRFDQPAVRAQVRARLLDAFSFTKREFGQPVSEAEVLALVQAVPGVIAAAVVLLADESDGVPSTQLTVELAHVDAQGNFVAAGLLLIDPLRIDLSQDLVP